jgi:hypothetical protein
MTSSVNLLLLSVFAAAEKKQVKFVLPPISTLFEKETPHVVYDYTSPEKQKKRSIECVDVVSPPPAPKKPYIVEIYKARKVHSGANPFLD